MGPNALKMYKLADSHEVTHWACTSAIFEKPTHKAVNKLKFTVVQRDFLVYKGMVPPKDQ